MIVSREPFFNGTSLGWYEASIKKGSRQLAYGWPWVLLVMTNKTQNCDLEIVSLVKSNFNFTGKTLIAIVVSHVVLLHIAVNVSLSLSSVLSCRPLPWSCRPLPCCPLPLSSRPLPLSLCHLSPPVSPLLLGGGVPWFVDFFVISGDWWDAELRGRVSHEPTKIHPQRFLIKSETIARKTRRKRVK